MRSLSSDQQLIIRQASKDAVKDVFRTNHDLLNNHWISPANRYQNDTIRTISQDVIANSINELDLMTYISASAPLHCADGWTYLSRAISSLIQGDFNTARHLGYYAELRAAISILAAEGIGIFDKDHFVIKETFPGSFSCERIPDLPKVPGPGTRSMGTHEIIWPVLEYWTNQPSSTKLIGSIITPYGVNLTDWHLLFTGSSNPAIGKDWLNKWGLDLHQLNSDHISRNEISYRPFRINARTSATPEDIYTFITQFWLLFSPNGVSKFDALDSLLLDSSLAVAFSSLSPVAQRSLRFHVRVQKTINYLFGSKPENIKDGYKRFLTGSQSHQIITDANSREPSSHPRHVFQILSRACLLLRIATGASAALLSYSSLSWQDFEFWWKSLGIDAGLWSLGDEPDSPEILWMDIDESIKEIQTWKNAGTTHLSTYNLHETDQNAKWLWRLSGTERIALWGLMR